LVDTGLIIAVIDDISLALLSGKILVKLLKIFTNQYARNIHRPPQLVKVGKLQKNARTTA